MNAVTDNIFLLVVMGMGGTLLLIISFIVLQMRGQNKLMREREMQQEKEIEHQKSLLTAIIQSQEGERKRIGQDLHDDVGAGLSSLRLKMDMLKADEITADNFKAFSTSYKQAIDHIITDVRHISHNLSPPRLTLFGLSAALEDLTDVIPGSGIKLSLNNNATEVIAKLDITVATALYRIFEELISNTIKHAAAGSIYIELYRDGNSLIVDYQDDGIGLKSADADNVSKGMGMQNMESRLNMINAVYELGEQNKKGFSIRINMF